MRSRADIVKLDSLIPVGQLHAVCDKLEFRIFIPGSSAHHRFVFFKSDDGRTLFSIYGRSRYMIAVMVR